MARKVTSEQYFNELAATAGKWFLPYIEKAHPIEAGTRVLELGCGEGGILLPFARMGCKVLGVDLNERKISEARQYFATAGAKGEFLAEDVFKLTGLEGSFDIIICHDVIEHLPHKQVFLENIRKYLADGGILFMSFPAWQMPFGGHQQICSSKASRLPWIHLLPKQSYKKILESFGEKESHISELLEIKETRTTIEMFEKLAANAGLKTLDRRLWFINPHYETKFGLKPRRLVPPVSSLTYLRNFFTTSCFYLLSR